MLPEIRHRYLMEVKSNYLDKHKKGSLSARGLIFLSEANESALDVTDSDLNDWDFIKEVCEFSWLTQKLLPLQNVALIGHFVRQSVTPQVMLAYDVITNYIECHSDA